MIASTGYFVLREIWRVIAQRLAGWSRNRFQPDQVVADGPIFETWLSGCPVPARRETQQTWNFRLKSAERAYFLDRLSVSCSSSHQAAFTGDDANIVIHCANLQTAMANVRSRSAFHSKLRFRHTSCLPQPMPFWVAVIS
jgi:hypothetical protein